MLMIDREFRARLAEQVRVFGIREALKTLAWVTDDMALRAVGNFNTVQGNQWAAWSVAIEALAEHRKLTDPGRE